MRKSYSKIRHIQESNIILERRLISEQVAINVLKLAKDIVNFIISMNIVPGPIDGAKLLSDIVRGGNPIDVIKNYVNNKINAPSKNWRNIERDLEAIKKSSNSQTTIQDFKNAIETELKSIINK